MAMLAGLHGCKVAITGRRKEVLHAAESQLREEGIECLGIQGDVRTFDDCTRWVDTVTNRWGQLNILVNCAAGAMEASGQKMSVFITP